MGIFYFVEPNYAIPRLSPRIQPRTHREQFVSHLYALTSSSAGS